MINQFKHSVFAMSAVLLCAGSIAQTSVIEKDDVPKGWHLKDLQKDGYYGISLDKAYQFVKGKKSNTIIVAVIDSGIDTTHEDLKPILWTNTKEIGGNGIDDDKNGYVDDIHGWNFLGGRDGRNVKQDSYEAARVYHMYKSRFENVTDASTLSKEDQVTYKEWKRAQQEVTNGINVNEIAQLKFIYGSFIKGDSIIAKELSKEEYSGKDLQSYNPTNKDAIATRKIILGICAANNNNFDITNRQLIDELEGQIRKGEAVEKAPKNYRGEIVQDNENDINDRFYGNNDVMASTPFHGTHVSGIIAALRNNGKGVDGVADNVRIMTLRAVPDGDEHDKDIALAIRYAVDNGAKVINMSFGKGFSPQKEWVDDAVKYAESKGVLLVHAAGNDGKNLDSGHNFPTPVFKNAYRAPNWLTVGASGDPKSGGLVADFSNYGKSEVDVFAPGVKIYSTIPGGTTYGNAQGTSMASPVVAGVAAFILQYYPNLTPAQVKTAIEKSSSRISKKVNVPGTDETKLLSEISRTGGLLNAHEAVKLAAAMSAQAEKPTPKPKVVNKKKA